MKYTEIKGDLFKVDESYTLAHCISADCKMGAGIAVQFVRHNPDMRHTLQQVDSKVGEAIYYNWEGKHGVINLITKERYYHKPTREDFNRTILNMKNILGRHNIKKLAIPLLGAGLDRLDWSKSSEFIQETFKDIDFEILVVKL